MWSRIRLRWSDRGKTAGVQVWNLKLESLFWITFFDHLFQSLFSITFLTHFFRSLFCITFFDHFFDSLFSITFFNHNCWASLLPLPPLQTWNLKLEKVIWISFISSLCAKSQKWFQSLFCSVRQADKSDLNHFFSLLCAPRRKSDLNHFSVLCGKS